MIPGIKKQKESGFTLLEVLVSMAILGIVAAAIGPVFHNHFRMNTRMERRTAAIEAAQQVLDNLRFQNPATMPASGAGTSQNISIAGYTFSATPHFCTMSEFCTSVNTRHIVVRIVFNGEQIYELETVYTKLR